MSSRVGIIIVNYKTPDLTIECLRSLYLEKELSCFSVVVVDNDSQDGSFEKISAAIVSEDWSDWVKIKASIYNGGFSYGNNIAIREFLAVEASPEYFYLLNPDTVVRKGAINELVQFMHVRPKVGIAGSRIETEEGQPLHSAFKFHTCWSELERGFKWGVLTKLLNRWVSSQEIPNEPVRTDWVSGASMMIRREVIDQLGLLDEAYFMYYEETDFCMQANRTGWESWYVPASRVVHFVGQSSGITNDKMSKRMPTYWFESRQRYFLKNCGFIHLVLADLFWLIGFISWKLRNQFQMKKDTNPPYLLRDFFLNSVFVKGWRYLSLLTMKKLKNNKFAMKKYDIMYVEGPGDVVDSFFRWSNKEDLLTETSKTYSGQFFEFCRKNNLKAYVVSFHNKKSSTETEDFYVENRPKIIFGEGGFYHLSQVVYGLRVVILALWIRPKYLDVTSGVTYWFVLSPLKLFAIKIVPHMHNCLWPPGFPPAGIVRQILSKLDGWFFRRIADLSVCVSPAIREQIEIVSGKGSRPTYQFRPQFYRKDFEFPPLPLSHDTKNFNIVFAGRIERNKGVFDLLEIAEELKNEGLTIEINGGGSALEELRLENKNKKLTAFVTINGNLERPQLLESYARAHVVIVPTRSDFDEGFAKVAAESVLLNRPVICSSTVPAVDVLQGAVIKVPADQISLYVKSIRKLMVEPDYYNELCQNCEPLRDQFLDESQGLSSLLEKILICKGE